MPWWHRVQEDSYPGGGGLSEAEVQALIDAEPPVTQLATLSLSGELSVAQGTHRLMFPVAATVVSVTATCGVAPTGASVLVDVHKNGTTIFTDQGDRPTIAATEFASASEVPAITAITAGQYLTVDVDQIGSTLPGEDLVVVVAFTAA